MRSSLFGLLLGACCLCLFAGEAAAFGRRSGCSGGSCGGGQASAGCASGACGVQAFPANGFAQGGCANGSCGAMTFAPQFQVQASNCPAGVCQVCPCPAGACPTSCPATAACPSDCHEWGQFTDSSGRTSVGWRLKPATLAAMKLPPHADCCDQKLCPDGKCPVPKK